MNSHFSSLNSVYKRMVKIFLGISLFLLGSCSYETPEPLNPLPGMENSTTTHVVKDGILSIRKNFFGIEINQEQDTWKNSRKRWLCGWASVAQAGLWKNWAALNSTPFTGHCNMEFHISKDGSQLEAREVNVDIDDPEQWQLLFTIAIQRHYFYEKRRDSRNRELNQWAKVSERKNWQVQPIMDLDLSKINVQSHRKAPYRWWGTQFQSIGDIEITTHKKKNYFGFSTTATSTWLGSNLQDTIRFNFLEFEGTPGFKKTPYDISVAKHMNILHILGSNPDGFSNVKYAAHWSLKEPIEVCLNGFPESGENYIDIGYDVLKEMNVALVQSGIVPKGHQAFVVSKMKPKYHFDLRCPSITWVEDPNLSLGAPLGIGLANTNVETGEILWGGAVLWGGLIDYLVNRDSESAVDALIAETHRMYSEFDAAQKIPGIQDVLSLLDVKQFSSNFRSIKDIAGYQDIYKSDYFRRSISNGLLEKREQLNLLKLRQQDSSLSKSELEGVAQEIEDLSHRVAFLDKFQNAPHLAKISENMAENFETDLLDSFNFHAEIDESNFLESLKSMVSFAPNLNWSPEQSAMKFAIEKAMNGALDSPQAVGLTAREMERRMGAAIDSQNTFGHHYQEWVTALNGIQGLARLAAAKSVIKNVMLHEWGHVVGLGHQFEGNRLPEAGRVPIHFMGEDYFSPLVQDSKKLQNYTSIMDYQSGYTEVSLPYDKVKIQIQDKLVLKYLYQQKYAAYHPSENDFRFFDINDSGVLKNLTNDNGKTYRTTYMPQCSDIEAWLAVSPYCKRWDRGYDAPSMVNETYNDYNNTFISRMNSFTQATGGYTWWASYKLWRATFQLVNHNRTFYDKLRYELETKPVYLDAMDQLRRDSNALFDFSKSCIDPTQADPRRQLEFAKISLRATATKEVNTPNYSTVALGENVAAAMSMDQRNSWYRDIFGKYQSVMGTNTNSSSMKNRDFEDLEQRMRQEGIEFTELQKLCRATKDSLDIMKILLTFQGQDHPLRNYDDALVPTGLRGANGRTDYSKVFGRYEQLGVLPIKLAALDLLTRPSSVMSFGWWSWSKPQYSDPNTGKYGYYTLFAKDFTEIIRESVITNMKFGDTILNKTASLSVSSLFMSYFLNRAFSWQSNEDTKNFDPNYLREIKSQVDFTVRFVPILITGNVDDGKPQNRLFGFTGEVFNLANWKLTKIPEVYVLPRRGLIARGNTNQILMPLTKVRFISKKLAYAWALDVTYDSNAYDARLKGHTFKSSLTSLAKVELDKCMTDASGLGKFFRNHQNFAGFYTDPTIAQDPIKQDKFEESVDIAFDEYRNLMNPSQQYCESSSKGIGLITATALSFRGWILPQVIDYVKK